jgi:hypothetical protein
MSEQINLDLLEEYNKYKGKIKQTIWIPLPYFTKLLELHSKTGIAINTIISVAVMAYLKNTNILVKEIEKPIEKVVEKTIYKYTCIFCWAEYASLNDLKLHTMTVHNLDLEKLKKT